MGTTEIRHWIERTGLVLEGGGMRSVFTAGVLDSWMDRGIGFPYVIGVSAGASNGISFFSRQRGRSLFSNIELFNHYDYIGWKHLLRGRGYIDMHFLFYVYPDRYYPLDYDACFQAKGRFVMVATDCQTGEAVYFEEKKDRDRLVDICCASCTLPILCPMAQVDGRPMVDGGVADAVPIHQAMAEGYERNIVILTRGKGYRKPNKRFYLPSFIYQKYPALREKLIDRYLRYNKVMDEIDRLEADGKILVIRPERPLEVERTTKDPAKLKALYEEGYAIGMQFADRLLR